jgi:hypothetical protein
MAVTVITPNGSDKALPGYFSSGLSFRPPGIGGQPSEAPWKKGFAFS